MLTVEQMANKYLLVELKMDTKHCDKVGMVFLFVEGTIGTICLIVMTACGNGLFDMPKLSVIMMILASLFLYTGLVLLNYSIGIGLVGVAVAIFNSSAVMHTVISYFALHQDITKGQIWGIILTFFGLCVLTMGELVLEKFKTRDD